MEIKKIPIKPLEVKIYEEGKCFICLQECEGYAHYECCLAYSEHKRKKFKELNQ